LSRSIFEILENSSKTQPDKIALILDSQEVTYSQLLKKSINFSEKFIDLTNVGDVISLISENSINFIANYFAILRSGCIAHIIPPQTSDQNIIFQTNETNSKLILHSSFTGDKIKRIVQSIKSINIDEEINSTLLRTNPRYCDYSSILFTSGTTGIPKGVLLKHANILSTTQNIVKKLELSKNDIELNPLPLSHSFGLGCIHAIMSQGGTSLIFKNTINLKHILKVMSLNECTGFVSVPFIFEKFLISYPDEFVSCKKSLRYMLTNSGPIKEHTTKKLLKFFPNTKIFTYYGLTEASRSTFLLFNNNLDKLTSVGKPPFNIQIKIIDEQTNNLQKNQSGEILIKGLNVIERYWKNQKNNPKIIDGWLYTGDLGHFDDDNYLYIDGRIDDRINVSGEKFYPSEIENILKTIDGISESIVVGIPDKSFGEIPVALIVGDNTKENNILKICNLKLENYKMPRIIFVSEIPTAAGKISRKLIREMIINEEI